MKGAIVFGIVLILAFISLSSASTFCDTSSLSASWQFGQTPPTRTFTCSNNGGSSISLTPSGSYISISPTSLAPNISQLFTVSFDSNTPSGIITRSVTFSDSSTPISLTLNVTSAPVTQQGDILIFPTSKVITVQQGQEKTQNILVTVPSSYPRTIVIHSVDFNPGTEPIKFGDLNLGQVPPGQSIQIPILFSAKDAQTGTYQTNLNIFATDSEGQINLPTISLQMQVSAGVTPVTNDTFSTRPSCSVSAVNMNINGTYTLTCSGVSNNLEVNPQYNEFLIGKAVDLTSGIYTYTFSPVKFGNTKFIATFSYKGSPVFQP